VVDCRENGQTFVIEGASDGVVSMVTDAVWPSSDTKPVSVDGPSSAPDDCIWSSPASVIAPAYSLVDPSPLSMTNVRRAVADSPAPPICSTASAVSVASEKYRSHVPDQRPAGPQATVSNKPTKRCNTHLRPAL